jgi:hypothetical protein
VFRQLNIHHSFKILYNLPVIESIVYSIVIPDPCSIIRQKLIHWLARVRVMEDSMHSSFAEMKS